MKLSLPLFYIKLIQMTQQPNIIATLLENVSE
jgi:hypothetical protein